MSLEAASAAPAPARLAVLPRRRLGALSALTPALMPVFAGLVAWLVLREPPGALRLLGYAAIVCGLVGLVAGKALGHGAPSLAGIAALVVAAARPCSVCPPISRSASPAWAAPRLGSSPPRPSIRASS